MLILNLTMNPGGKHYCNMNEKGEHGKLSDYDPPYWLEDVSQFFEMKFTGDTADNRT